VSAGLVPKLGIPYENGGPVALGVKGVVATAIEGVSPLCDVVAAKTMVAPTDDGKLGDDSLVVAIDMRMEEFSEEVTTFVSIVV
jgi:hypothetical protein